MTIAEVTAWLERFAPPRLAEPWDNVGLLLGDPGDACERVMTCLTVTSETADEAIEAQTDLIVSHHPVLFKGVKSLRADRAETGFLWRLIRAGIAVYSPHTAFDNARSGINAGLARRLNLTEVGPLRAGPSEASYKLVVFCPRTDRGPVLEAAFRAGAGHIGGYAECSFSSGGVGTFHGDDSTHPALGEKGRRESVREYRVELICSAEQIDRILAAIRDAHSYEEPAIDVYPLRPQDGRLGVGRVGYLAEPITLDEFARRLAGALGTRGVQYAGQATQRVHRVAIGCGAGDEFLADAARAGADVLLTGEARYHRALEAVSLGIGLVLVGHHASERPGVEDLAQSIAEAFPALRVWPSVRERDPLRLVGDLPE